MNSKTRLRDSNLFRLIAFVIAPLLFLVYCSSSPNGYINGLACTVGIYIVLAASLNLINGFSGMFSMGHAAFMAIGAYISAFLTLNTSVKVNECPGLPDWLIHAQVPFFVALLIGGLFASIVALLISYPVVRTKGHYLSVVTLALIVIVRAVIDNQDKITNGSRGLNGISRLSNIWTISIAVVFTLFVLYRVVNSDYGRGLTAMRDDPVAAQTLGINLVKKKMSCFAISAFFAGIGGGLWGHYLSCISGATFYFDKSFDIVEISIIGGMYSLSGSVLGAIFFSIVPEFLAPLENGLTIAGFRFPSMFGLANIIMAVFLIVLIIFRRQGLMGTNEILLDTWFSKESYTALFKKSEYVKLGRAVRDIFRKPFSKKSSD